MISELENALTFILIWFDQNGMLANPCKLSNNVSWTIANIEFYSNVSRKIIPENEQVKLLGIAIDSNLDFNSHIKEICGKVSQKTSALARL